MKNLLKKKSRIKVLLERSELIQFILCLLAMVLLCILNYLAAKWECSLAIPDTNSGLFYSLLLITFMAGNIVGLFLLLCILLVLKYAVVSTLTEWIRQFRAFNNYCYIPLTEDEVRGFSFASAREYFGHISQMLYYGGKDDEEKSAKYVQLKNADLNKMLAICLKVFPDNGTIFSLRYRDCKNICDDSEAFMQFLDFYHVSYESDEKYAPSANINKNGIVSLSVLNKDGRGIIWPVLFLHCSVCNRKIPHMPHDSRKKQILIFLPEFHIHHPVLQIRLCPPQEIPSVPGAPFPLHAAPRFLKY